MKPQHDGQLSETKKPRPDAVTDPVRGMADGP
jgi:hypothetical protein